MPQNATAEPKRKRLTRPQLTALENLLSGEAITVSAKAAKVSRETIHRWSRECPEFQVALESGQQELRERVKARLLALADRAALNIGQAIDQGDVKVSMALLKSVGALNGRREQVPAKLAEEIKAQDERMVEIIWRVAEDKMREHPDAVDIISETFGAICDAWKAEDEERRTGRRPLRTR